MESMEESSSYRAGLGLVNARLHSYAWIILLPAAAECTASVYYPSISLGGLDLQLAVLNVSGALLEGFFAAWESGAAVATGPLGDLFAFTADDVRGSFLSTYTSWAGMVGFAASLAHGNESVADGLLYMLGCIICGMIAPLVCCC